jgi:hypothetical protein
MMNTRQQRHYYKRRKAGLCVVCGERAIGARCESCAGKAKERVKLLLDYRRAFKLCVRCGRAARPAFRSCESCAELLR